MTHDTQVCQKVVNSTQKPVISTHRASKAKGPGTTNGKRVPVQQNERGVKGSNTGGLNDTNNVKNQVHGVQGEGSRGPRAGMHESCQNDQHAPPHTRPPGHENIVHTQTLQKGQTGDDSLHVTNSSGLEVVLCEHSY